MSIWLRLGWQCKCQGVSFDWYDPNHLISFKVGKRQIKDSLFLLVSRVQSCCPCGPQKCPTHSPHFAENKHLLHLFLLARPGSVHSKGRFIFISKKIVLLTYFISEQEIYSANKYLCSIASAAKRIFSIILMFYLKAAASIYFIYNPIYSLIKPFIPIS